MPNRQRRPISRRETLSFLGAGALTALRARPASDSLRFTSVNHVEFTVSNVEKSIAFYARIFGATVLKNNRTTRRYLKLGSGFIAMDQAADVRVDHFCAGIPDFDIAALHGYLEQRGIAFKDFPSGRDLYVTDPDGIRLQLASDNSWNDLLGGTASPEALASAGEPVFSPAGLDHILLHVADPAKSAAFYEKIFGPVTQRNNNRTWFQAGASRVGLLQVPAGQRAGVNHYCVRAASFDYASAMAKLGQAGAKVETPEVAGAPEFRDADSFLVQVIGPRQP